MAQHSQDGGLDSAIPVPSRLSFLSLPDIAHNNIASFLPDGNGTEDSRLRVSEVSAALLDSYGGSLTQMSLHCYTDSSTARLTALLRQHKRLAILVVKEQNAIPALCRAIIEGCCRGVERVEVSVGDAVLTPNRLSALAGALELDGALPLLRALCVDCSLTPGALPMLARTLAGGTSPLLQHLSLLGDEDEDMEPIADTLETRANIPGCKGLECFEGTNGKIYWAPLEIRVRFLRALLPSVKVVPKFSWKESFESCFLEVQAPYLTTFSVWLDDDMTTFSWKVLEAAPALVDFEAGPGSDIQLSAAPLQAVTAALRNGALRKLQRFKMWSCDVGDGDLRDFTDSFEMSGVANRIVCLEFISCD